MGLPSKLCIISASQLAKEAWENLGLALSCSLSSRNILLSYLHFHLCLNTFFFLFFLLDFFLKAKQRTLKKDLRNIFRHSHNLEWRGKSYYQLAKFVQFWHLSFQREDPVVFQVIVTYNQGNLKKHQANWLPFLRPKSLWSKCFSCQSSDWFVVLHGFVYTHLLHCLYLLLFLSCKSSHQHDTCLGHICLTNISFEMWLQWRPTIFCKTWCLCPSLFSHESLSSI